MMKSSRRPTIGFLTANVHTGAARVLWPGVLDAAKAGDANLICYPGGRLHSSANFEAERNVIYQLVDAEHLDGLVSWTSALAGTASLEEVIALHGRFKGLPIVSLASPLADSRLISINGYQGMRALIFHLVDVHHYQRIAILRGPEGHPYALERYHAYLDALQEKGLSPDLTLVTPTVNWESGSEAMSVLLDERKLKPGVDFQAVVAVSDLLAIGALNLMVERGIRVPTDVAVAGFNDIEEGRLVRPALTSVSLPFYEQGRRSVEMLMSVLAHESVPEHLMLDSRLLVRQSCGCPSQSVRLAAAEFSMGDALDPKEALHCAQEHLVEHIAQVISSRGIATTWAKQLVNTFYREITVEPRGQFRLTLDGMLQQGSLDGDGTAAWQSAISVLRQDLLPVLDADARVRAENLFGQARVVIGEAIQRAQIGRQLRAERQTYILRDIGQQLITAFDVNRLADVLAEQMPELGIKSCYLSIYETPAVSVEWSRLVLAYSEGRRAALETEGRRFPSRQLVPPDLLPSRRYSLLVEPLYFQTEPIGLAVFEIGPRDGATYEVLRGHISSALKGALLFREAHEARLAAERADQIKTRLLANVSHELRTPLNIIIGHTQRITEAPSPDLAKDLEHIQRSAEHQLRIINDLLDLSRAEINALDLYPEMLDPKPLMEDAFTALAGNGVSPDAVTWRLDLPDQLPAIQADPVRLRQVLLNLLSNASKFTQRGEIVLGAEVTPPQLHIWISDTGPGVPADLHERIYEPFFVHERNDQQMGGIGLGLSITRHLVALHGGSMGLDSQPAQGSTFHIYLPLPPAPKEQAALSAGVTPVNVTPASVTPVNATLWLISNAEELPAEIVAFGGSQGLAIRLLSAGGDFEARLAEEPPAVVVWDVVSAAADDWLLIRRLHNHPQLSQTPFVLYQQQADGEGTTQLTSLIVKPASSQALWEAIRPTVSQETSGSVMIVDDDPQARALAFEAVSKGLPDYAIHMAEDGAAGLEAILAEPPSLVILDLMMPHMDGFEVLDRMRADERTRRVPVVILTGRQLSLADVRRLENHVAVSLQSKNILSEAEIVAMLHRALFGVDALPPQTSALARQAIAYLQENYARPLSRTEIAAEIGLNEDYLSRVFSRELGISPWDYLNRYRILRAKELLRLTDDSVSHIARQVGFADAAYFSRVFHRLTGASPRAYRDHPDSSEQDTSRT